MFGILQTFQGGHTEELAEVLLLAVHFDFRRRQRIEGQRPKLGAWQWEPLSSVSEAAEDVGEALRRPDRSPNGVHSCTAVMPLAFVGYGG